MTPTVTWTPERVAELEAHLATKKSAAAIGRTMGLTKNMIIGRCWRTGAALPLDRGAEKIADADLPTLRAQRAVGAALRELAAAYGCTPRTIAKALKREPKVVYRPTPNPFPQLGTCLYPIGDPGEPGFRFCGCAAENKGMCAEHYRLGWMPVTKTRLNAIDHAATVGAARVVRAVIPLIDEGSP